MSPRQAMIGEVADVQLGKQPPASSVSRVPAGLPLLSKPSDFGDVHPTTSEWTTEPQRVARAGDVLVSVRGANLGVVNRADRNYGIGRGIAAVTPYTGSIDSQYLHYALAARSPELRAAAHGTTVPTISVKDIREVTIPVPNTADQRAIAAALGALDQKIAINSQTAAHLAGLAEAEYRRAVRDHVVGGVELRELAQEVRGVIDPRRAPTERFELFNLNAGRQGRIPDGALGADIHSPKRHLPGPAVLVSLLNPEVRNVWSARPSGAGVPVASTEYLPLVPRPGRDNLVHAALRFDPAVHHQILAAVRPGLTNRSRADRDAVMGARLPELPNARLTELDGVLGPIFDLEAGLYTENDHLRSLRDAWRAGLMSGVRPAPRLSSTAKTLLDADTTDGASRTNRGAA